MHAAVFAWTRPRRSILEPLRRVAEVGREQGDVSFATYALLCRAMYAGLSGERLPVVRECFELLERQYLAHGISAARPYLDGLGLLTAQGGDAAERQLRIESIDERVRAARSSRMNAWALWLQILSVLGEHERVHALGSDAWSWAFESGGMLSQLADYLFVWGISAVELSAGASWRARRGYRKTLRRCVRQLRIWAHDGPDFVHMVQALEAEQARLRGHTAAALALYAQSSEGAIQCGYGHHAALLNERRGRLLLSLRRDFEAKSVLQRAAALYEEWGASFKAGELRRLGSAASH